MDHPKLKERIGLILWFGDATKKGDAADYGYLQDLDNPKNSEFRIDRKSLNCSVENIKGKSGLLVIFERKNSEIFNIKPIFLIGQIESRANKSIKIDFNCLMVPKIREIIPVETIFGVTATKRGYKNNFPENDTAVSFYIIKNQKSNDYEACKISVLQNEKNDSKLILALQSQNKKIFLVALQRRLSILPPEDAFELLKTKTEEIEEIDPSFLKNIPNNLFSVIEADKLRKKLSVDEHLKICLQLVRDNSQITEELIEIAQQASENDWRKIFNDSTVDLQISEDSKLWQIVPDFIKAKAVSKYIAEQPNEEALKLAKAWLNKLINEADKITFVKLIPDKIKIMIEAKLLRQFLDQDNIKIYQNMLLTYEIATIETHNIYEEIETALGKYSEVALNSWFTEGITEKVVYEGFLWKIAPQKVKKKILEQRFARLLQLINDFQKYPKETNTVTTCSFYNKLTDTDKKLIQFWLRSDEQNGQSRSFHEARMLSARAAEKFASKFYESLGCEVQDISIQQVNPKEFPNSDWKNCDLIIKDRFSIDVKNARNDYNNKNSYSEFNVKRLKNDQNREEVTLAAVLSPYLKLEQILNPEEIDKGNSKKNKRGVENNQERKIIFLGQVRASQLDEINQFFIDKINQLDLSRNDPGKFLSPWLFDYPTAFYKQQREVIDDLKNLTDLDLPSQEELKILDINPLPLYTAAKIKIPLKWQSLLLPWQKEIISRLAKISPQTTEISGKTSGRITLPYLFLSLLSDFLDMVRTSSNNLDNINSYDPKDYKFILYVNNNEHPLGIYDPLNIINKFCNTLSTLWNNRENNRINEFKIFKFVGEGLLTGKRNNYDQPTTILAYCGGKIEQNGKRTSISCGYSPLVLGQEDCCLKCRKLICPKCKHCSENKNYEPCSEKIRRLKRATLDESDEWLGDL